MKRAANSRAWALGVQQRNGFHVRKVVWGRLMARMEQREGEHIRPVIIMLWDTGDSPTVSVAAPGKLTPDSVGTQRELSGNIDIVMLRVSD